MIEIKDLKKSYGSFTLDCSLSVAPGMITGLIGQNGAGKTTTFKALLGLIRPDGGTVSIMGQDPQSMDGRQKEKIGVVLSDSGFSGYLTVKDIIPVLNSLYHRFDRQYFIRQCQNFSLPMDKKIKDFSTGMKAKLKVLAAISHKANVLILDVK